MPAFRAVSAATGTDATGEGVLPSGVQAGDLMLAFVGHSASSATITGEPAGWSLQEADPNPADFSLWCYARVYQNGDAAPVFTFSAAGSWTVDIAAISGVAATPVNADIGEQIAAANAIALGDITPTVNDCLLVGFAMADASGGARTWTQSGSMTERLDQMNNDLHRALADELLSGGGGVPVGRTFTVSGNAQDLGGFLLAIAPLAGTQFSQSVSGAITPAGAIAKQDQKIISGTGTPTGVAIKQTNTTKTGVVSMGGAVLKQVQRALAGALTPAGSVSISRLFIKTVSGGLSGAGALTKRGGHGLSGELTVSGSVFKSIYRALSGALSMAGSLTASQAAKIFYQAVSGALDLSGALARKTQRSLNGNLTGNGQLVKSISKLLNGILSGLGTLAAELLNAWTGTPASRTLSVCTETRVLQILRENRTLTIFPQPRIFYISAGMLQ